MGRCCAVHVVCICLLLLSYLATAQTNAAHTVYVDGGHGVLNSSCCETGQSSPCKTLELGLQCIHSLPTSQPVVVVVESGSYSLSDSAVANITGRTGGLTVQGRPTPSSKVLVHCNQSAGFTFVNCSNVILTNLVFSECGARHNSTSSKFSHPPGFLEIRSALYFLLCQDVTLSGVSVLNSDGMGAVMYSTVGTNTIENCEFRNNSVVSSDISGGGGLYIEFSFCMPGDVSCLNDGVSHIDLPQENSHYVISKTTFDGNYGNLSNPMNSTFILPQKQNHIALGRGGGLSVFFKGNATSNIISVENCTFTNNTALWGAGIFVEYQDWSRNNRFSVVDTVITDNECLYKSSSSKGTGGGGARVGFIFFDDTHARNNSINFSSSNFTNNSAFFGGGLSFYAAREPSESSPTNSISFSECTFQQNVARAGSAVDLSVWHSVAMGAVADANFTDCSFEYNSGNYTADLGTVEGIGTMYADSIPVYFMGDNWFKNNTNSALAAVSTGIYFSNNSNAYFLDNTGRSGAAIALLGYAFIEVANGTEIYLYNNTAEVRGGAIYGQSIGEHDLISSRNCFIRYRNISVHPQQWGSHFYFKGNTANGQVNSIYATSLIQCIWGGSFGSAAVNTSDVFCWNNSTWHYPAKNCTKEIETAPASFKFNDNSTVHHNISLVPGQRTLLPITTYNDRGVDVTKSTVFTARSMSSEVILDKSADYISDNKIEVRVHNNTALGSQVEVSLKTINPRVIQTVLNITVGYCPPGMQLNEKTNSCACPNDHRSLFYGGRVVCNQATFTSQLQRGCWMGFYEKNILVNECPYCQRISNESYVKLPDQPSKLDTELCGKIKRTGTLCGRCVDGYGPLVNSATFECGKCHSNKTRYSWALYLLTEFLPITIFFCVVVLFDIRATVASANAFIFFAQVVPVAFTLNGDGAIIFSNNSNIIRKLQDVYILLYDFWNLNFFRPIQPQYCLSPNITTLQLITTGYVTAAYPLLLILLVAGLVWLYEAGFLPIVCLCRPLHSCLARFQQVWNIKRSLIHAFATFILLSYTKFTIVTFSIITTGPLVDSTGRTIQNVVYYDGTIDYMSREHAPYVAMAILVLCTFVAIPPILFSVPALIHNLQILKCWKFQIPWLPGPKLQQFLNAFHGCYKDGTQNEDGGYDYRWFSGLYFFFRVAIFAVFPFTTNLLMFYACLQFLCIIGVFVFMIFRPYKKDIYNKIDGLMFSLLIAINTLTMYNFHLAAVGSNPSSFAFAVQYLLIFLPIFYISVVIARHMYKHCCANLRHRSYSILPESVIDDGETSEHGDFFAFAHDTGRLDSSNIYHPASSGSVSTQETVSNTPLSDSSSEEENTVSNTLEVQGRGWEEEREEEAMKEKEEGEGDAMKKEEGEAREPRSIELTKLGIEAVKVGRGGGGRGEKGAGGGRRKSSTTGGRRGSQSASGRKRSVLGYGSINQDAASNVSIPDQSRVRRTWTNSSVRTMEASDQL